MKQLLICAMLVLLVGGATFWYCQRLTLLGTQLVHSTAILTSENELAARRANGVLEAIKSSVVRNHNQFADVTRLRQAEALHTQVDSVLTAFQRYAGQLHHQAGPAGRSTKLWQFKAAFADTNGPAAQRWQALRQQLAGCSDSLRRTSPEAARLVSLPAAAPTTTIVQARADLVVAQHQLLAGEALVLRRIAKAISYRPLVFKPLILATADNSVVAPGGTYRAHLLLASHLTASVRQLMTCNGCPVPVDLLGIGRVGFRAPARPGLAAWTGTIRLTQNGRDTTFRVVVPYRIARI